MDLGLTLNLVIAPTFNLVIYLFNHGCHLKQVCHGLTVCMSDSLLSPCSLTTVKDGASVHVLKTRLYVELCRDLIWERASDKMHPFKSAFAKRLADAAEMVSVEFGSFKF